MADLGLDSGGPLYMDFGDDSDNTLVCKFAAFCNVLPIEHVYQSPGTDTADLIDYSKNAPRNWNPDIGLANINVK